MVTLFEAIDGNVRQGTAALIQTLRQGKLQVAQNRPDEVAVTERVAALLLAAQYESRLHWLINHPNSRLASSDIDYVKKSGGTAKKWNALLRASLEIGRAHV